MHRQTCMNENSFKFDVEKLEKNIYKKKKNILNIENFFLSKIIVLYVKIFKNNMKYVVNSTETIKSALIKGCRLSRHARTRLSTNIQFEQHQITHFFAPTH